MNTPKRRQASPPLFHPHPPVHPQWQPPRHFSLLLPSASSISSSASSSATSIPSSSTTSASTSSSTTSSSTTSSSTTTSTTTSTTSASTTSTTSTSTTSATSTTSTTSSENTNTRTTSAPTSTGATQPAPLDTLPTTVFVTTTDSLGHTTTSAPITITSIVTFTSNGVPVTTTEEKLNPTLGSEDGSNRGGSSFFKNTGAVAGVFILVGLAAAAIFLWVVFGLRRRRRNRRREHDTAVSATLAAAGLHRVPLDDDDHENSPRQSRFADMEMRTGSALALGTKSSLPSARTSGYQDSPGHDDLMHDGFHPYRDYDAAAGMIDGYIPARTHSPPPTAFVEPYRDASGSGSGPDHAIGHSASQSVGSTEPLLASFARASPISPAPSRPAKNPRREADRGSQLPASAPSDPRPENRRHSTSSVYSSESTGDERLNPALRNSDIQDSEDYSRVLGVRNMPDAVSQVSGES
ncbi:hypothetical protein DFH09DRAFT_316231 [Mycena vulgaris]|nr:hypothetical protein DFH09DRAFT_316231 [Mycena vulgaris]